MHTDPLTESRKEFDRVQRRVVVTDLLTQLRGGPAFLLSFEDVSQKLRLSSPAYCGLQDVELERIIGSFERYHDFSRAFLPRHAALRDRWVNVHRLATERELPPVDLYQVGDAFFVSDGHNRISVARRTGARTVRAHVYAFQTRIPLGPQTTFEDLLIKEEYLSFLTRSGLDASRPEQCIQFTALGQYRELECQIALYQVALSSVDGRSFAYEEAATFWYDMIYTTVVQIIRQKDLLAGFPGRTEADMFAWVTTHQRLLSENYGYEVPMTEATDDVRGHYGGHWSRRLMLNLKERLLAHANNHHGGR